MPRQRRRKAPREKAVLRQQLWGSWTGEVLNFYRLPPCSSAAYIGSMSNMRIVGSQKPLKVGPRGPTDDEIRASVESAERSPRPVPRGVYRYHNHAEANVAMDRVDSRWNGRDG